MGGNNKFVASMGRSIEINGITAKENFEIRQAFPQGTLQVEFEEEPGDFHRALILGN